MIVKTEGVVLKSMRYRETSKIVTFYTHDFGKLSGIAKGARGPKNKFGASLEPMTHVSLVLYRKEHRDLQMISQCDIVRLLPGLQSDLEKITAGLAIVELVNAAMHNEERNEEVFRLLVDSLFELSNATKNAQNVFYYFRLHLMAHMGFKPDFRNCARCRKPLSRSTAERAVVHFDARGGGFLCSECAQQHPRRVRVSPTTVETLRDVFDGELRNVTTVEVTNVSKREIEEVLRAFEAQHVVDVGRLKSEGVARSLLV